MAGSVALDQIVLRVDRALSTRRQQQAGGQCVDAVAHWEKARFSRISLGEACKLLAEIGIGRVGCCPGFWLRIVEIYAGTGLTGLDDLLLSPATAVQDWPRVELTELGVSYIKQGQPVQIAKAPTAGWVRIFSESSDQDEEHFIGVGEIVEDGRVAPRKLVATH